MRLVLSIFLFTFLISCKENNGEFSVDHPETLKLEIAELVDSITHGGDNSCTTYQTNPIKWWNDSTDGATKLISKNISLTKIEELKCLLSDNISIKKDTLKGLMTVSHCFDKIQNIGATRCIGDGLDTNYIDLVFTDQKISDIIYYKSKAYKLRKVVSVQSFYMDETEITSNAYRPYVPKLPSQDKLDSIAAHKNDYTTME